MVGDLAIGGTGAMALLGGIVWYVGREAVTKAVLGGTSWLLRTDPMSVHEAEAFIEARCSDELLLDAAEERALLDDAARRLYEEDIITVAEEELSDYGLSELIEARDMWPDPIQAVKRMEDGPNTAYAWIIESGSSQSEKAAIRQEIEDAFIELNHREPQSLHLLVENIEEIEDLEPEAIRRHIRPWLRGTKQEQNG